MVGVVGSSPIAPTNFFLFRQLASINLFPESTNSFKSINLKESKYPKGRGIMVSANIEATLLPHLKDFGIQRGL